MLKLEFPRTIQFPPSKREFDTGDILMFSSAWPTNLGVIPGHTYRVKWHQDVPYDLKYILPQADYRDVNISDNTQNTPTDPAYENLYPYGTSNTLYQILIGFKPGNYMVHLYMPFDQYILGLEFTNMVPNDANMTNPRLKYIGPIKPEDSPYYDPRLKLVTVYNMLPFYMRFLTDNGASGDYEKCIAPLIINHCQLEDLTVAPKVGPEQIAAYNAAVAKAQIIRYVDEISFRTTRS